MSLFDRLLEMSDAVFRVDVDRDGRIRVATAALRRLSGVSGAGSPGAPLWSILHEDDRARVEDWLAGSDPPDQPITLRWATNEGQSRGARCVVSREDGGLRIVGELEPGLPDRSVELLTRLNNEFAVLARERAQVARELRRAQSQTEASLVELQTSFWHLRKVQEVLPICMGCGKLKSGESTWETIVDFLRRNEILLSHGYCPPCGDEWERSLGLEEERERT